MHWQKCLAPIWSKLICVLSSEGYCSEVDYNWNCRLNVQSDLKCCRKLDIIGFGDINRCIFFYLIIASPLYLKQLPDINRTGRGCHFCLNPKPHLPNAWIFRNSPPHERLSPRKVPEWMENFQPPRQFFWCLFKDLPNTVCCQQLEIEKAQQHWAEL